MSAEVWKTEFHVIGQDGQAFAWEDDLASAAMHCQPGKGAVRIERVTYYHEDRETVWTVKRGFIEESEDDVC